MKILCHNILVIVWIACVENLNILAPKLIDNCEPSPIQWQDLLSNIIQDSTKNKLNISRQTGIPLALTLGYAYMDFLEFWTYQ